MSDLFKYLLNYEQTWCKKMGYFKMIKLLLNNYRNRNNIEYFKKDIGYW